MSNAIVPKEDVKDFADFFKSRAKMKSFKEMLPKHLNHERVATIAISAAMRNPRLFECTKESVWLCVAEAAKVGLEAGVLGGAYLVPFRNSHTNSTDCVLIYGYQGLIELALRHDQVSLVEARVVRKKDDIDFVLGLNPRVFHTWKMGPDRGDLIAVYAVATMKDGSKLYEIMEKSEINEIRKRSRAGSSGPWVTDFDEMARKTVVRRLCKYLPKSPELRSALTADDAGEAGVMKATMPTEEDIQEAEISIHVPEEKKNPAAGAPKVDEVIPAGEGDTSLSSPADSTDEASTGSPPDESSPTDTPDPGMKKCTRDLVEALMKEYDIKEGAACRMITKPVIPTPCTSIRQILTLPPNARKLTFDRVMEMLGEAEFGN